MTTPSTNPQRLVSVALGFVASFAFAAEPARKSFDIPARPAEKALRTFTEQSCLQVGFPTEITDGVRTNAVHGEFTPMDAAERLLAGTHLKLVADEKTGVYSVIRIVPPEKNGPSRPPSSGVPAKASASNGSV
ncbi:MAG: STN domain-containing protein, partial [Opitutaceae bacterium]